MEYVRLLKRNGRRSSCVNPGDLIDPQLLPVISGENLVLNEIPTGDINGSNATFTTASSFIPGSIALRSNGIQQRIVDDFQTIGANTIQLNFSPMAGEKLEVDYIKI